MRNTSEHLRLFFALWPEAELLTRIRQAVDTPLASCHGRHIPASNWHITLAFIGSVEAGRLACLRQVAGELHAEGFSLSLDQLGYWPRPRIIWLAPTAIPSALISLQADLTQSLVAKCDYQAETRAYRPHLSLLRKAALGPEQAEITPIEWQVKTFSLVCSHTRPHGPEYEVLNYWPLV